MAAKKIPFIEKLSKDTRELYKIMNGESDLAAILIGTSFLDKCLASILHSSFIKSKTTDKILNPSSGALGMFSSRMDLAYCLGHIKKKRYQDLTVIAKIRNLIAHSHLEKDFKDKEVIELCDSLQILNITKAELEGREEPKDEQPWFIYIANQTPRNKFIFAVIIIVNELILKGLEINQKDKKLKSLTKH